MESSIKTTKSVSEGLFLALFPINVLGIIGFWVFYLLLKPIQFMTPGLVGTLTAEVVTAVVCIWAFFSQYFKLAQADSVTLAAAGMLFFGSIQGIGDAISSQTYALIWVMGLNIVIIPLAFYERIRKHHDSRVARDPHHKSGVIQYDEAKHRGIGY